MIESKKAIIMGAAGRDFHNFNVHFRNNPRYQVVGFTAYQIPNIAGRVYPPELAGEGYQNGIPIYEEEKLAELIRETGAEEVIFAYSDVSHDEVMHRASLVNACGADFRLMGTDSTMLESTKPVIAVGAVRTGCGKSQVSRTITHLLAQHNKSAAVIRHPMPYGDLVAQRCQRLASLEDLDAHRCTIEEREEYEPHIASGHVVFAGVDYEEILRTAEREADIVVWEGGNNDFPFYRPDLYIVLVDPHRAGHELHYHPGETNLLMADIVLINKVQTADADDIEKVRNNVKKANPGAQVIETGSAVQVSDPKAIAGKRVLVVEDGPTVTHGGMNYGAGYIAATAHGASEIVDPRQYAVGSIAGTYAAYPHLSLVLPAMGYGEEQLGELSETINQVPCDLVLVGTPIDLGSLLETDKPLVRVTYEVDEAGSRALADVVEEFLKGAD